MAAPQYYGNVHFLGVARIAGTGIVIASHSYNTETDLNGVRQVLEQPNMSMAPGKHYSFNVAQLAWHLIADDMGLIYILICKTSYPQRCAHTCLEELQRTFVAKAGDKARTAKDRSLDKACGSLLQKICQKYDNLNEIDKLASVSLKVESVKLVMQDNVDMALQNCVKLESIEKAAEELQQQAGVFKRNAHELKKRMWWKNLKMKLIVGGVILVILGIIAGIIAYMVDQNKK
mmetsp:Transcript_9628/g.14491  ORF Transcript_9628/g.14491 Transcript_9628/m.14491 type:complete len:232 (-) Transcript_9628:201-896(-)|eukprot:CAMPEP_0185021360 /NCGR_PEP_ID=MMETSP1103-20130426/4053_1 /TAXON_ID=36769 /ORGANISM="Paraphysomonas bandaiensis, Strain Caron Lab Isolate" /LENGTH=231 /DNA_ID=CAMNT_0027552845 /DNA_START=49 /DNA_END=744 /DNA_ORIENTATION=-